MINKRIKNAKPIHLHDAIFVDIKVEDVLETSEPRILTVYAHLSPEETEKLIKELERKRKEHIGGTIIFGIVGRMV